MFNLRNKYDVEVIKYKALDINNIIYKVTTNTLLKADKAIQHIKRNKKIYKNVTLYFAICMSPELIKFGYNFGYELIVEFIRALAIMPKEELVVKLTYFFKEILSKLVLFIIAKDLCVTWLKHKVDELKYKKYVNDALECNKYIDESFKCHNNAR